MKRKILFSLGGSSFSNIEFTSEQEFTEDEWGLMRLELAMAKDIIGDSMPINVKMISSKQEDVIRKYQDKEKDIIIEYLKELSKTKLIDLTMDEASDLIKMLLATDNTNKSIEDVNKPIKEEVQAPDWVEPQRPDKCVSCGNTEFTLKTGTKKTGGEWYGFICTNTQCKNGMVFVRENNTTKPVASQEVIQDTPNNTPPKITSANGVPEWAMKQLIEKNTDINGREFEYVNTTKDGKDKYYFRAKDKKGGFMDKGLYYVNPPVVSNKSNYDNYDL